MARPQANNATLDFTIAHGNGIINIPRALSLLNRKSYRAGYVYSVDYVEYIGAASDTIRTGCLPCSYPLFQAYRLGFDVWREQRAMAINETNIEPGKWSDFKPYYDINHLGGAFVEYGPCGLNGTNLQLAVLDDTNAEWNHADIEVHDVDAATSTTYAVGMLGDTSIPASYGSLMDAYGATRSATVAPDLLTPDVASYNWITRTGATSESMSGELIVLIEDENDNPPYANQTDTLLPPTYVGNGQSATFGLLLDVAVTGTTGRAVNLNGGLIPLGLMVFSVDMADDELVGTLRVHCTRGEYKGVAALSMGDFS